MATRRVYTLYGDVEALGMVINRLVENSFAFHYTGEFLYGKAPWDEFIENCCKDINDRLVTRTEEWADLDESFEPVVQQSGHVMTEKEMDAHVLRVRRIMQELASELESLDPIYIGGEDWDPDDGYLFTAESTSPLREAPAAHDRQGSESGGRPPYQKDLSGCVAASRIRHQTEWVLKKKMPDGDRHVMMCISFCDGAIPEPPNPYNDRLSIRLDI